MTPTDELCAKLGELGIKYTADDSNDYEVIEWGGTYNLWWQFVYDPYEGEPYGELRLLDGGGSTSLTPEQAIAVTVGAGTCKIDFDYEASRQCQGPIYRCDSCGVLIKDIETSEGKFKYCPNCGRKIEEEAE